MKIKINRDNLVKSKGKMDVPEGLNQYNLSDKQSNELTKTLIECITIKSPSGLFSNEGEDDETT